jgi:hypothetical protein
MSIGVFSFKEVAPGAEAVSQTQEIVVQDESDAEESNATAAQEDDTDDTDAETYLDYIFEELNLQEVDDFSEEVLPEHMTLSDVTKTLLGDGVSGIDAQSLLEWVFDVFFASVVSSGGGRGGGGRRCDLRFHEGADPGVCDHAAAFRERRHGGRIL